jgi:hypothetical protein
MQSLNQLIQLFEDKKANHTILSSGTFYFGDPWEFAQSNEITYPFWGCTLNNSVINGNLATTNFQFFFCDLVHKDESNETDVLSDLQLTAMDIYSQLKYDLENYYDATVNDSAQLNDFTARFNDEVSGWELAFNINQFYDQSTCGTISTGNAGRVTIIDSDGNVITYLNPNTTYTVTQLTTLLQDLSNTPPTTIIQDLT